MRLLVRCTMLLAASTLATGCMPRLMKDAGYPDKVNQYLDEGDDPNETAAPNSSFTMLLTATNCSLIKKAIAKGANVNLEKFGVETPLIHLALTGQEPEEKAKWWDTNNKNIIKSVGSEEKARQWLRKIDLNDWCPLYDATKILLEAGADPNHWGFTGNATPIMVAVEHQRYGVAKALLETKKVDLEFHWAKGTFSKAVNTSDPKWIMEHAKELVDVTPSGWTPLIKAVDMGDKQMVEMLLAAGANPNNFYRRQGSQTGVTVITTYTWLATALDVAKEKGHKEIAAMLENAGGIALNLKPANL